MDLCVDMGNSTSHFVYFKQGREILRKSVSSKQLEIKKLVLDSPPVKSVMVSSVVKENNEMLSRLVSSNFELEPQFVSATNSGPLKIDYLRPEELGADRISSSVGALSKYKGRDLIIFDLGTASTVCAVGKDATYYGGAIFPGINTMAKSLNDYTSKLPLVDVERNSHSIAKGTYQGIQDGIYLAHLGAIREFISKYTNELFNNSKPFIVATGGNAKLFEGENIFDEIDTDLVIRGVFEISKVSKNH